MYVIYSSLNLINCVVLLCCEEYCSQKVIFLYKSCGSAQCNEHCNARRGFAIYDRFVLFKQFRVTDVAMRRKRNNRLPVAIHVTTSR